VPALELRGDAVAQADDLHRALGHAGTAAITTATAERATIAEETRIRLRWSLNDTPTEPPSLEPAPSWEALCGDAVACFRTGPWPDAARWLAAYPPTSLDDPSTAIAVLWGGEWPHVAADALHRARERVPEAARGFFDTALAGLGDVAFAGGRLDAEGTGLAFARVPSAWVNFTSSVLAWAGLPPNLETLSDGMVVSWSKLPRGGVVMALDDGDTPTMGWVAYATEPEAFAWLRTAPRTAAGDPALWIHLERVEDLRGMPVPEWLRTFDVATLRLELEEGWLTARADLREIR